MRVAKRQSQGMIIFRDRNYVHVIGHQTVGQNSKLVLLRLMLEQPEIGVPGSVVGENNLLSNSALSNVVSESGGNHSGNS